MMKRCGCWNPMVGKSEKRCPCQRTFRLTVITFAGHEENFLLRKIRMSVCAAAGLVIAAPVISPLAGQLSLKTPGSANSFPQARVCLPSIQCRRSNQLSRSEEHTSELQSRSDLV